MTLFVFNPECDWRKVAKSRQSQEGTVTLIWQGFLFSWVFLLLFSF